MRAFATTLLIMGTMLVGLQLYLAVVPYSPALGMAVVVGTGAALAAVLLRVGRVIEQGRRSAVDAGSDAID